MKKTIVLLLTLIAITIAAERMVLGELLTSTTCPPCVGGNATVTSMLASKSDYLAVVRYHMNWPRPGNDPWYHYNKSINNARRGKYGVNSIPTFVVDGTKSTTWGDDVDKRHNTESPLSMKIYQKYTPYSAFNAAADQGEGMMLVEIHNEGDEAISARLFTALTGSNFHYTGTNGDPVHHQVALAMMPYAFGKKLEIDTNETVVMAFKYAVDDSIPVLDQAKQLTKDTILSKASECELVAWVQKVIGSKEVIQAAKTKVKDSKNDDKLSITDISLVDVSGDGKLSPNEEAKIHFTVHNEGKKVLKDAKVFFEINTKQVAVTVTKVAYKIPVTIPTGGTYVVEGDELMLKANTDYDGKPFELQCYAGTENGSLGYASHMLAIDENLIGYSPIMLPSFAKVGSKIQLAPNDVEGFVNINIFDVSGRKVANLFKGKASNLTEVTMPSVNAGIYFVCIKHNAGIKTAKIVLLD